MSKFIDSFKKGDISFTGMYNTACQLFPNDKAKVDKLYDEIERGKAIINDEDHLNVYLKCFGEMHHAKLHYAFRCFTQIKDVLSGRNIEVYDWGCGQGIATVCLLDYLINDLRLSPSIVKVVLVDPSETAVKRAEEVLDCYRNNKNKCRSSFEIIPVTKSFEELKETDISSGGQVRLHLFSNVLDINFNLVKFISIFQKSFKGNNYFVCVGPYYSNSKRVDDFISAINPDCIFAAQDLSRGQFEKNWTNSMRIFYKDFHSVEKPQDIRVRIQNSRKHVQLFAGHILDCVAQTLQNCEFGEQVQLLLRTLSTFDVRSNKPIDLLPDYDSKCAVLNNIISRGLPTLASIKMEEHFSKIFMISKSPTSNSTKDTKPISYDSLGSLKSDELFEALHLIDPRFSVSNYNGSILESSFEKAFIEKLSNDNNTAYITQLLEPQRPLSTLVSVPDERFVIDRRVDFSLQLPYSKEESQNGFIVEVDGAPYHSNLFCRLIDERRDELANRNNYETSRINDLDSLSFINEWEKMQSAENYLRILKKNYNKDLDGEWADVLQIVLTPFAVARIEKVLLNAIMSGNLNMDTEEWNVLVVERDVPCAYIAIDEFVEAYSHLCNLEKNCSSKIPKINLDVVSTKEFENSSLHLENHPFLHIPNNRYDVCIDISMLLRDNVDAMPLPVNANVSYVVRSSHYEKRKNVVSCAKNISYDSIVKKTDRGEYEVNEKAADLKYFLQNIFRRRDFRPGQLPIISRVLSLKNTIGLLPTGGGKSLTYQLSAMLQPGVTLIVDPLISLMVDQVRGLKSLKIDCCACVNSTMDYRERNMYLKSLEEGHIQIMRSVSRTLYDGEF